MLAAALSIAALAGAALAQPGPARTQAVYLPEDTGAGDWPGTYLYISRDVKVAMWIRLRDGIPEIKVRYLSMQAPETFETDWKGDASYTFSGLPGTFALRLQKRGERTIEGTWRREVADPRMGLLEEGTFSLYRTGNGRAIVMKFDKLDLEIRDRGIPRRVSLAPVGWTFWKYSKRSDALWDELPI